MKKQFLIGLSAVLILSGCGGNDDSSGLKDDSTTSNINESSTTSNSSTSSDETSTSSATPTPIDYYAVIDSEDEYTYIYGYVGETPFDLNTIDVSNVTSSPLSYSSDNSNVEVREGKIHFANKGFSTITASNSDVKLTYKVIVNEDAKSKYSYPEAILPESYTLRSGAATSVSYDANSITLTSTTTWTRVTFDLKDDYSTNYTFEADAKFITSTDASRWFSLVFQDNETDLNSFPYYQYDVRKTYSSNNGVELTQVYGKDQYSYPHIGSYDKGNGVIMSNETVHLKVIVDGYNVTGYFNEDIVFETTIPTSRAGDIGFQCGGSTVQFSNISVSYADVSSPIISYADTQSSKINVNYASGSTKPNIIASGSSEDEIYGVGLNVQQFYVKMETTKDGDITLYDALDNKMNESLNYLFKYLKTQYIPNIEVSSIQDVVALKKLVSAYGMIDLTIWSDNSEALRYAHETMSFARTGYISSATSLSTPDSVTKECQKAGAGLASLVLVDHTVLNKNNVTWFTGRGYSAVASVVDKQAGSIIDGALDGCSLILAQYDPIIRDEIKLLYNDDVFNNNTSSTNIAQQTHSLFATPYTTGHRGAGTNGSNPDTSLIENTIGSMKWAYEHGALALEIDVHSTSDNKLAIIHDETTGAFSPTNLTVKSTTLERLQSITLNGTSEHIPSLNEVFETFSDDKYAEKTMVIEVKDNLYSTGKAIIDLSKEYGWYGRYTLITFNAATAKQLHDYDPTIPCGYLATVYRNDIDTYWQSVDSYLSNGVGLSSQFSTVSQASLEQSNARGQMYWLWTYGTANSSDLLKTLSWGNKGFTTNYLSAFSNNVYKLTTDALSYDLALNATKSFDAKAVSYTGINTTSDVEVVLISGNASVNKNSITRTGQGDIKICLKYKTLWKVDATTSKTFYVYSDVLTIK